MNLVQLMYFKTLAETEHLLKTAETLCVSASAISISIRNLEDELGTTLFNRVGRGLVLNKQGKVFYPYVNDMFKLLNEGQKQLSDMSKEKGFTVSISIMDIAYYTHTASLVAMQPPHINFRLLESRPSDEDLLSFGEGLDFIITAKDMTGNNSLSAKLLWEDPFILMVSQSHQLARRKEVSLAELEGETFLVRPSDDAFQKCVESMFSEIDFSPNNTKEYDYLYRLEMVRKNLGIAVAAKTGVYQPISHGIVPVEVKEFYGKALKVWLYFRKTKHKVPRIEAIVREICAAAKQFADTNNLNYREGVKP